MLKSMNLLFSKDPQKILQYYDSKADDKNKIIQRLWQLEAYPELLEIVKMDSTVREYLIHDMMKANLLDISQCEQLLIWMNVSKLQSDVINYIKNRFTIKDIEQIIRNINLNPNARKNLEKIAIQKSTNIQAGFKYVPDERYMKLRMILEDSDWFEDNPSLKSSDFEEIESADLIKSFLDGYSYNNTNDKIKLIISFFQKNKLIENDQDDLMNILISLSDLSYREKILVLAHLNKAELYKPEFFIPYTDFYYHDFEMLQPIFSLPVIKTWVQHYYYNNWIIDLLWLKNNYLQFDWIVEFIHNIALTKVFENQKIFENELLNTRINYTLMEIIRDSNILNHMENSSKQMHEFILQGLSNDYFDLEFYIKPLLMIGGDFNFNFLNQLLNRKPVESMKDSIENIEKKYLKIKKETEDPNKLRDMIAQEVREKESIIFSGHYQTVFDNWIEAVSRINFINPSKKNIFIDHLPDIKAYVTDCDKEGKLTICRLISSLKLINYKNILEQFIKSNDITLQIHSIAALKNLDQGDVSKYISSFADSPNVLIRQEFSRSLHLFKANLDDAVLIKMSTDSNPLVSEFTLNHIASLAKEKALNLFSEVINKIPGKNKNHLAKLLGSFHSSRSVKLLTDLLNHADCNLYKSVMQSLISINHPTCLVILQNMELNKNFILEMERARALILLGDFNGWNQLRKYFNLNLTSIQNMAKMIYIELAGMDQIRAIRRLALDKSPLIAAYASIKIFFFSESEGQILFDSALQSNDYEKLYYLTMVIEQLPYQQNKNKIALIYRANSVKCKTIAALVAAKNNDLNLYLQIEKDIMRLDESDQLEMLRAVYDYPIRQAFSLLQKMAQLHNNKIIRQIIDLLKFFEIPKNELFTRELWFKSDVPCMIALIEYVMDYYDEGLYEFIKTQFKAVPFEVQAHIARAIIVIENNEEAWSILENLMREDDLEIKKSAMDALCKIEDARSFNILNKFTASPSEDIQVELIKAIGNTGNPEALNYLSRMSDSSSSKVKIAVAKSLGNLSFNESRQILEKLKIDRDEYVRVSADISLEKLDKGNEPEKVPFLYLINGIFKESSWLLSEVWFEKELRLFKTQYHSFKARDLTYFNRKVVLEQEDYFRKENEIKHNLEKKLIQNTDVDQIVKIKKDAESEMQKMVIKEELVISLLEINENNLNENDKQIIYDIINAEDEDLIKAIILKTGMSKQALWIEYLQKIVNSKYISKYIDLIIYSLFKKKDFKALTLFSQLLYSERGRYYFVYLINYYIIYQKLIISEEADVIFRNITHAPIDPNQKKSLADLVQRLFTIKGINEK